MPPKDSNFVSADGPTSHRAHQRPQLYLSILIQPLPCSVLSVANCPRPVRSSGVGGTGAGS